MDVLSWMVRMAFRKSGSGIKRDSLRHPLTVLDARGSADYCTYRTSLRHVADYAVGCCQRNMSGVQRLSLPDGIGPWSRPTESASWRCSQHFQDLNCTSTSLREHPRPCPRMPCDIFSSRERDRHATPWLSLKYRCLGLDPNFPSWLNPSARKVWNEHDGRKQPTAF